MIPCFCRKVNFQYEIKEYKISQEEKKEFRKLCYIIGSRKDFEKELQVFEEKYQNSPNIEKLYSKIIFTYSYTNNLDREVKKIYDRKFFKYYDSYKEKFKYGKSWNSVINYYMKKTNKNIYLYPPDFKYTSYTPQQNINLHIHGRNLKTVNIEVYKVDFHDYYLVSAGRRDILKNIFKREPLVSKNVEWLKKYSYSRKNIDIEKLEKGYYIFKASADEFEVFNTLMISELSYVLKQDNRKILLYVFDKNSGIPKQGVNVFFHNSKKIYAKGKTDQDGIAILKKKNDIAKYHFYIQDKEEIIYSAFPKYPINKNPKPRCYFYSDRPVYRPEQKSFFKIIIRDQISNLNYSIPSLDKYKVIIKDSKGNKIYEEELEINEYGTVFDSVTLGSNPALGWYSYSIKNKDNRIISSGAAFRVEEYKKPEFKMEIKPEKSAYLNNEEVVVDVNVKYYFGKSVKDSKVDYEIEYTQIYKYMKEQNEYSWFYGDYIESRRYGYRHYYPPIQLKSGETKTDNYGNCKIIFKPKNLKYTAAYTIKVLVTDKSRRQVTGSSRVKIANSEFRIQIKTDKYIYKPGDIAIINYKGKDINGELYPFKGQLSIKRISWTNNKTKEKVILNKDISTDEKGLGFFNFKITENGYYEYKIISKDSLGNRIITSRSFRVRDKNYSDNYISLELEATLDKDLYYAGDTATLIIDSPFKKTSTLVTLEQEEILAYKVINIKQNSELMNFNIDNKYAPGVFLDLSMIKNDRIFTANKIILVPPKEKMLNIKILSAKTTYKPGEEIEFKIEIKDNNNNPVECELSLGITDESLYYIQDEFVYDIRKYFLRNFIHMVETRSGKTYYHRSVSQMPVKSFFGVVETLPGVIRRGGQLYIRGGRGDQINYMVDGVTITDPVTGTFGATIESIKVTSSGMNNEYSPQIQKKIIYVKPEIREYFPDTGYWKPDLKTDKNGIAIIKIKLPDTLTTWRGTVRGITKDTKVGIQTYNVKTFKNILARLELPRFITLGDKFLVSGIIHNYLTESKNVKSELVSEGVELKSNPIQNRKISPGKNHRFDWLVSAKNVGSAEFILNGLTDVESDAMKMDIPIIPFGLQKREVLTGVLTNNHVTEKIKIPETAIPGTLKITMTFNNGSVGKQMFDSLGYLIGFPYGCVEQTMSRFLPNVMVAQTIQRLGLEKPAIQEKLPKMVEMGLNKLHKFQKADGGWGWWKDSSSPYMTAYVMYGLTYAIEADYQVDIKMYKNGITTLKRLFSKEKTGDQKAYMAFVISHFEKPDKNGILKLYNKSNELSIYGKSLLAMALFKVDEREKGTELVKEIKRKAKCSKQSCHFESEKIKYSWRRNDVEVTTYVFRALVMNDPTDELIPKILNWLQLKKTGNYWVSTKDTAAIIFGYSEYLAKVLENSDDLKFEVSVNDTIKLSETFDFKNLEKCKSKLILSSNEIKGNVQDIKIRKNGDAKLYYTIILEYFSDDNPINRFSSCINVKRSYVLKNSDKNPQSIGREINPYKDKIYSGDVIEVEIELKSKDPLQYLMIEDYIPAGCEIVNRTSGRSKYYWIAHQEFRDEKAVFFITKYQGKKTIKYKLRAEIPGTYNVLPTIVTSMYFPEVYANSSSYKLTIVE